jgi:hypothetical protein
MKNDECGMQNGGRKEIKARNGLRTFALGGGGPLATSGKWVKFTV